MLELTHRVEQALLGALIYDPSLLDDVPYLLPRHFADSDHQIIYAAILDVHVNQPDAYGAQLSHLIAIQVDTPAIDEQHLSGLALSCPDITSAAVYGRMVHEAALRRELATHAERLTRAAGLRRGLDPHLDHLALLADALKTHTHNLETTAQGPADESMRHDLRALQEEQILADLIQHPDTVRDIATWLDPEIFTSPARREIYETIITVDQYGEPVEELTLAWELARSRALAATLSGHTIDLDASAATPTPGYIARLYATTVEIGAAATIGRDLLTDHVRTELTADTGNLTQPARSPAGLTAIDAAEHAVDHHRTLGHGDPRPLIRPSDPTLGHDGPQLRH